MQEPAQLVGLAFKIERSCGGKRIGVQGEDGAVFGAMIIIARDAREVGRGQGFGGDGTLQQRPLQRRDRLLGWIEPKGRAGA